jgi:peptidoglycan hydrolase-like protein with peptidoglycan-binding domain
MRRSILLTVVLALAAAAPAAAQDPVTPPPPPPPPPPVPLPPATGTLSIALERVNHANAAALAGDRVLVRGTLNPYVAGQRVHVRLYRDSKRLRVKTVTVRPGRSGRKGTFVVNFQSEALGRLTVRATHDATPQLVKLVAKPRSFDLLPRRVGPGSSSRAVRGLQKQLKRSGYVIGRFGSFDDRTARAVLAFRKVSGMARTTSASTEVLRRLAAAKGRFRVRFPRHGKHVEADLSLQVMALIGRGGKVERIYPVSSGSPVTPTVLGSFKVYRKDPGTNAKGMVYSSYFIGGYAIHGYASVPVFPASHGCLRVPVPDAVSIFNWVSFDDRVDVYL